MKRKDEKIKILEKDYVKIEKAVKEAYKCVDMLVKREQGIESKPSQKLV